MSDRRVFRIVLLVLVAGLTASTGQAQSNFCLQWNSSQLSTMSFHNMVFDSDRGVSVLYGGRDKQTWEWDGNSWRFKGFGGPPWINHEMVYDSVRHVMVGVGSDQFSPVCETWEMDAE